MSSNSDKSYEDILLEEASIRAREIMILTATVDLLMKMNMKHMHERCTASGKTPQDLLGDDDLVQISSAVGVGALVMTQDAYKKYAQSQGEDFDDIIDSKACRIPLELWKNEGREKFMKQLEYMLDIS